jgi:hypothetical protein
VACARLSGDRIADLLFSLNRDFATTLILVTHDEQLAARCDRRRLSPFSMRSLIEPSASTQATASVSASQTISSEGVSRQLSFMTMTFAQETPQLADVKAVDDAYPMFGTRSAGSALSPCDR